LNKLRLSLIGTLLVVTCLLGMSVSLAAAEEPTTQSATKVELTEQQKNELANLHKDLLAKKEQLITKYVEYGVISEDKGMKMKSRMEEHYKKLEQNGFIPSCNKHKHKHNDKEHMKHD
jgi:ribosomal protein S20